jgi:hypothetical protein
VNNQLDENILKLLQTLEECNKHILRISHALEKMQIFIPLNVEQYQKLTEDDIAHIDQLIFRFSKLQDTMGDRLFPLILIALQENVENKPFLDILNRLEKLNIIDSSSEWLTLRGLRNVVTHEYALYYEELVNGINRIYKEVKRLYEIYAKSKEYIEQKVLISSNVDLSEYQTPKLPEINFNF